MTAQQFFANALMTVRILWAALTFSCGLLGVITAMVPSPATKPPDATTLAMFAVLAVIVAIVSFVLPARVYATNAGRAPPQKMGPEPTPAGLGPARFAHPLEAARKAMANAFTPFILSMALSEAVALLGVVVHMQGASMAISTAFIVTGAALGALRFPTVSRLVGPYERLHGASFAASEGGSY